MTSELSPQQKAALEQFHKAVVDVPKPSDNDIYMLQWLKARNFDPMKAETMLRESMAWRKKVGADDILETWPIPEVIRKYFGKGLIGCDKEGCPVWICPHGNLDIRGLLHSVTMDDMMLHGICIMEESRREMSKQSQRFGRYISQHVIIIDLEGMRPTNFLYKPWHNLSQKLTKMQDENYPETLKRCFLINAPKLFALFFSILRLILSENTMKKIQVFNSDRTKWVPALLEVIDADQLPKYWGGTMVDPDGDPKCPSKILMSGEIPKSYYLNIKRKLSEKCSEFAIIKSGNSLILEYDVVQPNSRIRWSFVTEDYDIGFVIHAKCSDGLKEIRPHSRVDSHISMVEGETSPLECGKYTVAFDNTYSKMRNKSVCYTIQVISPQSTDMTPDSVD